MAEELKEQFDIGASGTTYAEKYGFFDKENYCVQIQKGVEPRSRRRNFVDEE